MAQIGCYCRVSTAEQNLTRQVLGTLEYAQSTFDSEYALEASPNEVAASIEAGTSGTVDLGDIQLFVDKSTGTNTERQGYCELMAAVDEGTIDVVIAHSVSRVCRSIQDLETTVDRVVDEAGAELHIVSESFQLTGDDDDPYQRAMFQLLGVFAELEARIRQQNTREGIAARQANNDYRHGRAPLGFEKDDGTLIQAPTYHDVVAQLDAIQRDEQSKRRAAKELGTSRRTINRALDRADLYGL